MTTRLQLLFLFAASLLYGLPSTGWAQGTYQAETAQLAGGATVGNSGGVSCAEFITQRGTASVPGSSVTFASVAASAAKTYAVDFRYSAARAYASSLSIYVNGVDVTQALYPSTTSWSTWAIQTVALNLRAGNNTIMLRYDVDDNGWINLDYIQVRPETVSTGYALGAAPTAGWFPQEISVDKFTGTAQLYLPLHTVQANGISVPIGLSYAATGVQVDDRGGKVGVNWALAGGVSISRQVRGLPDDRAELSPNENRYGWLVYPTGTPDSKINAVPNAPATISATGCTGDESIALLQLNQIGNLQQTPGIRNFYDSEPDIFSYSIPGHSGKFVFDAQGNARTIPYDHIAISYPAINIANGITSFTIRTADGTTYLFDVTEKIEKKLVNVTAAPNHFLREHRLYKLPDNNRTFRYTYSWLATNISTVAGGTTIGEKIEFTYRPSVQQAIPSKSSRLVLRGAGSGSGVEEYKTETTIDKAWLETITSSTTRVTFNLVLPDETEYFIQSVDVLSTATTGTPLIRRYLLDYLNPESTITTGYDRKGNPVSTGTDLPRRFLGSIRVTNGCSTQPLYKFTYDQVNKVSAGYLGMPDLMKDVVTLPLVGANDRDYWGFYTPNGSQTLIPKLYVYPQLLTQAQPVPAAPYRLFEVTTPAHASGGFTLPGADRRPAACFNFQSALAGTLTSLTLPGGGKALFEYEAHRFYDPVAQQSYPAGGTRIRAIRVQDPITGIEARREYGYQESDGRASGVLLRAPRFAFALPSSDSPGQPQWTDATARCGDDLSEDPFETRPIGYHQVSEQVTGKGRVVTTYHVPGSADESTAADGTAAGVSWNRAVMGVARQTYISPVTGSLNCPAVAPLQAGTDLYPFAPATNYDFRRGLPQNVTYNAEPVGTAAPVEVRRETFSYEYRNLKPALPTVIGLVYEQLNPGNRYTYAYAKYPILTDFLYAIRHQTEVMPNGLVANNQSDTWYNYNAQGWLAGQGKTNSDGKGYRTRYKYLADYAASLTGSGTEPRFLAMQQRLTTTSEKIGATPIETISEVVISPSEVRFAGATLNTFAPVNQSLPTRSHQVLRWMPAAPLSLSSGYDSVRVVANASGNKELYVSPNFRVASTLLETTTHLVPLSTRTEAGRQLTSVHLGYNSTLPVLQIANALSSEVLFSDFESVKEFGFNTSSGASINSQAARTGQAGAAIAAGAFLSASLPISSANYRLSFWARVPTAATPVTVTVSIVDGGGSSALPAQSVNISATGGSWQLYEVSFNTLSATITKGNRGGHTLKLLTDAPVQLDDVLFLPTDAAAASTTYDATKGKTSETDGRGRSVFYEYNILGDLARVRDHNGAIVKQIDKVVAGRVPEISPSFAISGNQHDGVAVTFTANATCGTNLQYSWDFGDGTTLAFPAATGASHTFNTAGQVQTFTVTLSARVAGQSKVYRSVGYVEIRPAPISVSSCFHGVESIDLCGFTADVLTNDCDPSNVPPSRPLSNTYTATVGTLGSFVYTWMVRTANGTSWQPTGQTGTSITVPINPTLVLQPAYQCIVSNTSGVVVGTSETFALACYYSRGTAENPCPTIP